MNLLSDNKDCEFAKYFKNLGYDYRWDCKIRTGERWHELWENGKLILQVDMVPLEDIIKDFCITEETTPYFKVSGGNQKGYEELLARVRKFENEKTIN